MMGSQALVSPAMGIIDAEGPVLYVEFLEGGRIHRSLTLVAGNRS